MGKRSYRNMRCLVLVLEYPEVVGHPFSALPRVIPHGFAKTILYEPLVALPKSMKCFIVNLPPSPSFLKFTSKLFPDQTLNSWLSVVSVICRVC